MPTRAIDCWVNVNLGGVSSLVKEVGREYFKQGEDFLRSYSVEEMVATMDVLGVEKAILTTDPRRPDEQTMSFVEALPERFLLAAQLDPRKGMKALRALEQFQRDHPNLVIARITPFAIDLPPNHAVYFPVYAKCIELDLPISINTGIPGPRAPGECQHPMHLDRVCLHFPELKLVMAHGADPWWGEATRLMIKYPNLYMMTSAYLPKYFPPDFVHFMNTRGRKKVLWASDHPAIQMERCIKDAMALDLRDGVLDDYLYANAARLFFDESGTGRDE